MIYAVTGRTGEGKTCFAVSQIILPALLTSNRVIVTNISLNIENLTQYMEKRAVRFDPRQLILLPAEADGLEGQEVFYYDKEGNETKAPFDAHRFWECCPKDALVVFDEAGEYLNSIDLRGNSEAKILGSYARLHRHMGHDTYLLVQDFKHMAAQVRDLVHTQVTLYSYYQHPLMGLFKIKMFMIRWYDYGKTANAPAYDMKFRSYKNIHFTLYDSFQHRDYHASLEADTNIKKENISIPFYRKIISSITGSPMLLIVLIALCFIGYGIYTFADFFGSAASDVVEPQTQQHKKDENTPLQKIRDASSRLFGADSQGSNRKSSSRSSSVNTYTRPKVRSFGLANTQGSDNDK